ncbi:transcriptional regulator domain-containing protein [Acidovorax sp. LjRoot129]|uniref:transcriptional regulator domain-containing protein n=1 Tax=Acidovorax sp. LjRoot129 TaxID=3342260 RepID=UPI003F508A80
MSAAYLYVLDLDHAALAWEYLRRNPGYCSDWARRKSGVCFARWGLRCRRRSRVGRTDCAPGVAFFL